MGANVHLIPAAEASVAAIRAPVSAISGLKLAACPKGIGKMVLNPCITSLALISGIPGVFYGNALYFIEDVWVGYAHHGAYSALACFGFKVWEVLTVQLVHLPYLLFQCHLSEECLDTLFCLLIRFVISGIAYGWMK